LKTLRFIGIALAVASVLTLGVQYKGAPSGLVPVVQAQSGCSERSLRGNYGFQINGNIIGLGPIAGTALVTYDGAGNFTQIDNVNINGGGIPVLNRPGSGSYIVNADCTGTQTLNLPGQVTHTTFVIVGNRKQVFDVGTDPHVVITGVGKAVGLPDED
jgi:hypothetical protein